MKLLVIADIFGRYDLVERVVEKESATVWDGIIVPGDLTDMFAPPTEFTQLDTARLVIYKLLLFRRPVLCVPGNHDPYEVVHILEECGANAQERMVVLGGMVFLGWGGALTPFGTRFEPTEEETQAFLSYMEKKVKRPFVFITHNPAKDTALDTVGGRHIGSLAIREFILRTKPTLALSAHIDESAGTDRLGETTLFYPGPLTKGRYGVVVLAGGNVQTEIRTIPTGPSHPH